MGKLKINLFSNNVSNNLVKINRYNYDDTYTKNPYHSNAALLHEKLLEEQLYKEQRKNDFLYGTWGRRKYEKKKKQQEKIESLKREELELAKFVYVTAMITKQDPLTFLEIYHGKYEEITKRNLSEYIYNFYKSILIDDKHLIAIIKRKVDVISI